MVWGAHNMGLPSPAVDLLVQARGQVLGCFVLRPTPGYPVSLHRRVVAVAIADQVGAALDRSYVQPEAAPVYSLGVAGLPLPDQMFGSSRARP